jgi:hypothetical protein
MSKLSLYIVGVRISRQETYLLWMNNPKDALLYDENRANLIKASSIEAICTVRIPTDCEISSEPVHWVDFDWMIDYIGALEGPSQLTERDCKKLLDCWNLLDDLYGTLNYQRTFENKSDRERFSSSYDQIFYGSNLPSITPKNESYTPVIDGAGICSLKVGLVSMLERVKPQLIQ